jgi:hypothetical protein
MFVNAVVFRLPYAYLIFYQGCTCFYGTLLMLKLFYSQDIIKHTILGQVET